MNADIIYGHHFHSSLARIFWQAHNQLQLLHTFGGPDF